MKRFTRWLAPAVCSILLLTGCKPGETVSSGGTASSGGSQTNGADIVNFTGLSNHAAGSKGFVEIKDGHFYVGDERIRFFGVSVCSASAFPSKKLAEQIAEDLARHGVNCVRLHHMDWPGDEMIFEDFRDNTLNLDAEKLDRMDYFVHQLEQRGIYINFNTHVSRQYAKNDGMPAYEDVNFAGKYINYFDEKALELQKDYAKKLFDRVNPYTGKKYAEDPGVAMVEITNENWMYLGWTQGYLHPNQKKGSDRSTWSLPEVYLKELDASFNQWLKEKYGSTAKLLEAWTDSVYDKSVYDDVGELKGIGSALTLEKGNIPRMTWKSKDSYPDKVLQDNAEFYTSLEMTYYRKMLDYFKEELGFRVPLTTTNGYFGNPSLYAQTLGDYTDTHYYLDTLGDKWKTFEMSNISIVRDNASNEGKFTAQDQWIGGPALSKVKGKPLTVCDPDLFLDQIDPCHPFCDRMFHLDSGIHFHEIKVPGFF